MITKDGDTVSRLSFPKRGGHPVTASGVLAWFRRAAYHARRKRLGRALVCFFNGHLVSSSRGHFEWRKPYDFDGYSLCLSRRCQRCGMDRVYMAVLHSAELDRLSPEQAEWLKDWKHKEAADELLRSSAQRWSW